MCSGIEDGPNGTLRRVYVDIGDPYKCGNGLLGKRTKDPNGTAVVEVLRWIFPEVGCSMKANKAFRCTYGRSETADSTA